MLQSMGLQRVEHDWATEQQQGNLLQIYLFSMSIPLFCYSSLVSSLPPTPSSPVNLENSFLTLTPSSIFLINPFWSFPSPEHNPASIGGYVAGLVLAQGLQNK